MKQLLRILSVKKCALRTSIKALDTLRLFYTVHDEVHGHSPSIHGTSLTTPTQHAT
jgi:hypothetical protein